MNGSRHGRLGGLLGAGMVATTATLWGGWAFVIRPSGLLPLQSALVVMLVLALPAPLVLLRDRTGFPDPPPRAPPAPPRRPPARARATAIGARHHRAARRRQRRGLRRPHLRRPARRAQLLAARRDFTPRGPVGAPPARGLRGGDRPAGGAGIAPRRSGRARARDRRQRPLLRRPLPDLPPRPL